MESHASLPGNKNEHKGLSALQPCPEFTAAYTQGSCRMFTQTLPVQPWTSATDH